MSSVGRVFDVLRSELKAQGLTYRTLAQRIGLSESSVKRLFSEQDMPLSRLAQIGAAAGLSFEELLARAAQVVPELTQLTLEQERALVADPKLLMVALCCLSQWRYEQMLDTYALSAAEVVIALTRLDRLGLIVLKPGNRYRLAVGRGFHWRRQGPIMDFLRRQVLDEYFDAAFDGRGETLVTVHGQLTPAGAEEIEQRVSHLASALAQRQREDQAVPGAACAGYTLIVGLRSFELRAFTALRRRADQRTRPVGSNTDPKKR
jgi:transcriptional regulator with XRE-family HTH domain